VKQNKSPNFNLNWNERINYKDLFLSLDTGTEQGGIFYIALNFVWYNFAFIARESELFRNLSEVALDVVNGYIYARKNFIAFNVFLHFSGLLNRSSRWAPAYYRRKIHDI